MFKKMKRLYGDRYSREFGSGLRGSRYPHSAGDAARAGSASSGESGFTLVEMLVAMMVFSIIITIVMIMLTTLITSVGVDNRSLVAQDTAGIVSNSFSRLIRSGTVPPAAEQVTYVNSAGTTVGLPQAVLLACPDAMIFYSDLPEGTAYPNGGWVYIYLATSGISTPSVYTLKADLVSYAWVNGEYNSGSGPLAQSGSSGTWSSTCGASSQMLTSQVLAPPTTSALGLERSLIDIAGVYEGGATPTTSCTAGQVDSPCYGPQLFTVSVSGGGNNSGFISCSSGSSSGGSSGSSSGGCASATTNACTGTSSSETYCTTNAANVVGVYYDLSVKDLSCTACDSIQLNDSPNSKVTQQVLMDNVAINDGIGFSGVY